MSEGIKKYCAEFIGTFVLVLVACGVAAVTGCNGEANGSYILTALAFQPGSLRGRPDQRRHERH